MAATRGDVVAAATAAFPGIDAAVVLAVLDDYGSRDFERECERVQLAALQLAGGDLDKLKRMIAAAKVDYRDVLMWASQPPTAEETAAELAKVKDILQRWGRV